MVSAKRSGGSRNPTWDRKELILALDLYLREGLIGPTNPKVIALSELLNRLQIHTIRPDRERFRNPNGVAMKLANFAALDPNYPGTALQQGGRGDAKVWDEFLNDREALARAAAAIRAEALAGLPSL